MNIKIWKSWSEYLWKKAEDSWISRDGQDHFYRNKVIIPALEKELEKASGIKSIIDLGCGDGRHLVFFSKLGYDMYGLDYAPMGIQLAEEWLSKEGLSAKLVCTDMTKIPWSDEFFDAVICSTGI